MIVLFGNEKGGVGKSTLTLNIALALKLAGKEVAIVDCDPQATVSSWLQDRRDAGIEPYLPSFQLKGRCGKEILELKSKYDYLIVDVAGSDGVALREAAVIANLWLVPTAVDYFDTQALITPLQIIRTTELSAGFKPNARLLLNRCSPNPRVKKANLLIDAISNSDGGAEINESMPPMQTRICYRSAYPNACEQLQSVIEYAKKGSKSDKDAANEIMALYAEIFGEAFTAAKI